MPEELQGLLDRIRKDGVDKAEAQAAEIIARAKKDAAATIAAAEQKAREFAQKAESDAAAFKQCAEQSLQHAARDVVLTVGDAVSSAMRRIAEGAVDDALSIDTLKDILGRVISSYFDGKGSSGQIEVLVSPKDHRQILDFFMSRFREAVERGLEIKSDSKVVSGFRISMKDGSLYHDFSGEAIAQAMCSLLQPHLAEIVRAAMTVKTSKQNSKT